MVVMIKKHQPPYSSMTINNFLISESTQSKNTHKLYKTEDPPISSKMYLFTNSVQNAPSPHAHLSQITRWKVNASHVCHLTHTQVYQSTSTYQIEGTSRQSHHRQNQMGPNRTCIVELRTQIIHEKSSLSSTTNIISKLFQSAPLSLT